MYVIIENALINCPWCKKAKQLSLDNNLDYCVISINPQAQKQDMWMILRKYFNIDETNIYLKTGSTSGALTFPQIFSVKLKDVTLSTLEELITILDNDEVEVEYIGGYQSYEKFVKSNLEN